ncbi:MAG: hypothetical protein K1X88_35095 [Nannocystaceae bacterium]|nr:hypothetical protein [Nannocystaceae bacterium]
MLAAHLLALSLAPAAAEPLQLRWDAPAGCPDSATVRSAVEQQLGRAIAAPLGDGLTVTLRAAAGDDGRWRAELTVVSREGTATRELPDASDCAAAVEAAALVIAIAIDPQLGGLVPAPEPEPEPEPEPAPEPAPLPDDPTVATPTPRTDPGVAPAPARRPRRIDVALGVAPVLSLGDLPTVGGHGRVWLALALPRLLLEATGSFGGGVPIVRGGATVTMQAGGASVRACARLVPRPWLEVLPCGGVAAGVTLARTQGLRAGLSRDDAWAAFVLAPGLWLGQSPRADRRVRAGARLGLELGVPVPRRDYTVSGARVFRVAAVTGALVAGLELRFAARP